MYKGPKVEENTVYLEKEETNLVKQRLCYVVR